MISICVLTYNGEKFVKQQLLSILQQLKDEDEVIISDDCSSDSTISIIKSLNDKRIRIFHHERIACGYKGTMKTCYLVGKNAENALQHARGEYIFLADQDDVWLRNKVEIFLKYLKEYDLVISNHTAVHADLQLYEGYKSNVLIPTLWNTLYRTQFLGCCMAFHRRLLSKILPFPQVPLMHDIWIGLMALKYGRIGIIQEPLLLYRRHGGNASVNLEKKSSNSLTFKILYRFYILKAYLNG